MKKIAKNIKLFFAGLALLGLLSNFGFIAPAYAQDPAADACAGIRAAGGTCDTAAGDGNFRRIIGVIIRVLSIIVGAVSVIMLIIGGFRYVISGGDSNATKGAKDTIMYAIIGLVFVLFAQIIVSFVFAQASPSGGGDSDDSSIST